MYMLTATFDGTKYAILRHDPALEKDAEAVRRRWAEFYPWAVFAVEVDSFDHGLPGYSAFYDAMMATDGGLRLVQATVQNQLQRTYARQTANARGTD